MKLAFYAPLKSPDHPTPSGERTMARAVMAALEYSGASVDLASDLRSRDGKGDPDKQRVLHGQAAAECTRLIQVGKNARWQAWVTYHNYYKAPDLLGPAVAQALNIPYLQIESTRARKRLGGPWDSFAIAAEAATDAADVIFFLTTRDAIALRRDAPPHQRLIHLRPFLERSELPPSSTGQGPMLSVGMMRDGDKLASYTLIAQTLALLPKSGWQLSIAGDGPARENVERLMAPFANAVTFRGVLDPVALSQAYQNSRLLFWPGVNEAFGLAYLEAQAHGLPVVAQDRPGVCDVLAPGTYPSVSDGPAGLAKMLKTLMSHPMQQTQTTRRHVTAHHLLPAAAETLRSGLALAGVDP